jgi:uncharacterized membrane protein
MFKTILNKKRLRNYGMWAAVISLAADILIYAGVITVSESETLTSIAQRILELLVLLGIISNPTNPNGKGFNL